MSKPISELNQKIHDLVQRINSLIEQDFEFEVSKNRLSRSKEYCTQHEHVWEQLEPEVIKGCNTYERFLEMCDDDLSTYKRVSTQLCSHHASKKAVASPKEWTVPVLAPEPSNTSPSVLDNESLNTAGVKHAVFAVKRFYRARTHYTVTGAQRHIANSETVLSNEEALTDSRERRKYAIQEKIDDIKNEIENYRASISSAHAAWTHAYNQYADAMRNYLIASQDDVKRLPATTDDDIESFRSRVNQHDDLSHDVLDDPDSIIKECDRRSPYHDKENTASREKTNGIPHMVQKPHCPFGAQSARGVARNVSDVAIEPRNASSFTSLDRQNRP